MTYLAVLVLVSGATFSTEMDLCVPYRDRIAAGEVQKVAVDINKSVTLIYEVATVTCIERKKMLRVVSK